MPNHVHNFIEFPSAEDAYRVWSESKRIVESNSASKFEEAFDFSAFIPMPPSLLDADEGSVCDKAIAYALYSPDPEMDGIKSVFSDMLSDRKRFSIDRAWERTIEEGLDAEECERLSSQAQLYAKNIEECGHMTWYTWSCAHWNTKWNAYECDLSDNIISFTTAWNAPTPVFEAIITKYPDIPMGISWYEEQGIENVGEIVSDGCGMAHYYQGSRTEVAAGIYARCLGEDSVLFDPERKFACTEEHFEEDPEYFEEEGIQKEDLWVVEASPLGEAACGMHGVSFEVIPLEAREKVFPRVKAQNML